MCGYTSGLSTPSCRCPIVPASQPVDSSHSHSPKLWSLLPQLRGAKSFFFGLELLFYGCCNKSSQTWWLRTTEMYSLTVLEVKTPNSVSLRWKDVQHGYSSCRPSAFPLLKNVYSCFLLIFFIELFLFYNELYVLFQCLFIVNSPLNQVESSFDD